LDAVCQKNEEHMPTLAVGMSVFAETAMDNAIRLTVLFGGDVQGVGFRYTAVSIARGFKVTGYVRNLPDGRVELVAEGEPAEVRAFVAAVDREMAGYIRETKVDEGPATKAYTEFGIRP
jgi:acylphosphatase